MNIVDSPSLSLSQNAKAGQKLSQQWAKDNGAIHHVLQCVHYSGNHCSAPHEWLNISAFCSCLKYSLGCKCTYWGTVMWASSIGQEVIDGPVAIFVSRPMAIFQFAMVGFKFKLLFPLLALPTLGVAQTEGLLQASWKGSYMELDKTK